MNTMDHRIAERRHNVTEERAHEIRAELEAGGDGPIGDLPLDAQGKLLRLLQEGEVVRVGEHEPRPVDGGTGATDVLLAAAPSVRS